MKIWQLFKEYAWILCIALSIVCYYLYTQTPKTVYIQTPSINIDENITDKEIKKPNVSFNTSVNSSTEITAVEKENINDADLVVKDNYKFKANINGKDVEIVPQDKESFEFKKDSVNITRDVEIEYKIKTTTLQPHFGLGIGIDTKGNPAMSANIKLKKAPIYFWGASNFKDSHMIGVGIYGNFN